MKPLLALFLTVAFLGLSVSGQALEKWVKYASVEGRYAVLLPAEPKLSKQDVKNKDGLALTQYLSQVAKGNGLLMVGYFDYAADKTFSLQKAQEGMIANIKGTLVSEEPVSLGRNAGKAVRVKASANGIDFVALSRFFDVDRRIYILIYLFPEKESEQEHKPQADKFFDSFSVNAGS